MTGPEATGPTRRGSRWALAAAATAVVLAACGDGPSSSDPSAAPTAPVAAPTPTTPPRATGTVGAAPQSTAGQSSTSTVGDAVWRQGEDPCPDDELPAVVAFAAASGDQTWSVCSDVEAHRFVLGATDDAVYLSERTGVATDLVAYGAADGRERWRRPLGPVGGQAGWPKGPIAGAGIIVVADGAADDPPLVGLDAATGEERWRVDRGSITAPPFVPPGGVTVQTAMPIPPPTWFPVAGTDDVVVLASSYGDLAGLDRSSGAQRWSIPVRARDESGDMAGLAAAAVLGDRVMVPAGAETVAIDAGSGTEVWRGQRLDDPWAADEHVVGVQPPASQGIAPSEVAVVDAATGATAAVVAGIESYGDRLAVGDGGVFVRDPVDIARITGYELATGAPRWTSPAGTDLGEPQLVHGDLVITLWEGTLTALATDDGTVRWAWRRPVGSDWMNAVGANGTTLFVAVNSLPFGD